MLTFEEFLAEGRDAPLYHATSGHRLARILETNTLKAYWNSGNAEKLNMPVDSNSISFTRSFSVAAKWRHGVVIEFDQGKLARQYSMYPINFGAATDSTSRGHAQLGVKNPDFIANGSFWEERIIKDIKDIKKYIKAIYIDEQTATWFVRQRTLDVIPHKAVGQQRLLNALTRDPHIRNSLYEMDRKTKITL